MKHPGAVLVVDDDVAEDGAAFLVMELLDGLSCDRLAIGSPVPVALASAITLQLLDVLAAAHDKGIIHRDVKPANLFLTRAGTVKVLDFGIARVRELMSDAEVTGTGVTLGTPAFMAPEHARGRAREIDGRTDQWAAGATLFTMVSGELVHEAETTNEFLIAAGTRVARSLSIAAPDAPAGIVRIVDRALSFHASERWPGVRAMRDALLVEHRAAFGTDDVFAPVAAAVRARGEAPEEPKKPAVSAVETNTSSVLAFGTSAPLLSRVGTERLSLSAAGAEEAVAGTENPRARGRFVRRFGFVTTAAAIAVGVGSSVWVRLRPRPVELAVYAPPAASPPAAPLPAPKPSEVAPPSADPAVAALPVPTALASVLVSGTGDHPDGFASGPARVRRATSQLPQRIVSPAGSSGRLGAGAKEPAAPIVPATASQAVQASTLTSLDACDPPYVVDAAGRHVYKPQCLK